MSESLIRIENLVLEAGDKTLVDSISMEIEHGSVMGLVGESGSGKTLTALSVLRLLPKNIRITKGSVTLVNEKGSTDLLSLSAKELNKIRGNRISMIFQEPMTSLDPTMRCGEQVREAILQHMPVTRQEAKQQVISLFDEVMLPDPMRVFSAWPHELSGGQRQRVMIAQALSTSPDLLIADEPTTALDVTVQKSILDLLLGLRDKYRLSILFITHDLTVIRRIADRISVMYQGKIVESGNTNEVMEHPVSEYTKALIACKPGLDEKPYRLPTIADFMGEGSKARPGSGSRRRNKSRESKEAMLTVKDLHVTYKGRKRNAEFKAVDDVSFEIFRGETLGLVGEWGSGKTTLGRTLLQLIREKSGNILYKGTAINELSERKFRSMRRELQIVFQDPYSSLDPKKTISSIVSEPLRIHKILKSKPEIAAECRKLLEQCGLPASAMNLYPHQFSGGQRQRIGIARALACRPEFIVLDESVSALDVSVQAQIINLLNDLKDEYGLTYLFISHDLTVVKYISDRILVMKEGRIVESGDPDRIYMDPKQAYTRKLIDSIPG